MSVLERKTQVRPQVQTRTSGPGTDWRNPERPLAITDGDWPLLRPHKRVPEGPSSDLERTYKLENQVILPLQEDEFCLLQPSKG